MPLRVVAPITRERPQLHVHRARAGAFAERDIDAKILHRRVHEFLDRFGQPVDFVDEQDRAFLGVREVGQQILGRGQRGAAGDLQGDAQIARDAGGESRFAQAGRTIEQDVAQRLFAFAGRIDGDRQPLGHLLLADHLVHVPGPKRGLVVTRFARWVALGQRTVVVGFGQIVAGDNCFARHADLSVVRCPWFDAAARRIIQQTTDC